MLPGGWTSSPKQNANSQQIDQRCYPMSLPNVHVGLSCHPIRLKQAEHRLRKNTQNPEIRSLVWYGLLTHGQMAPFLFFVFGLLDPGRGAGQSMNCSSFNLFAASSARFLESLGPVPLPAGVRVDQLHLGGGLMPEPSNRIRQT